jgi:CheY-like chemotaxis protein
MITPSHPIRILLADDDHDDHFLFDKGLKETSFNTQLTTVEDGAQLMDYLFENSWNLPDVLFLDHNMPCKNGAECLQEIKVHPLLKLLPVIMYSTYVHDDIADLYYVHQAHFYMRKTTHHELRNSLQHILTLFVEKKLTQPEREKFILSPVRM